MTDHSPRPAIMKISLGLITSAILFLPQVQGATLGTADECCCGSVRAEGTCCDWGERALCPVIPNISGSGISCVYDVESSSPVQSTQPGDCVSTAFECPDTIVCPEPANPTPAPTPEIQPVPPSDSTCMDVPNFGVIDSSETCGSACDTFGIRCVAGNCVVSFRDSTSTINNESMNIVSCTCGPTQTQICEDKTTTGPTPPDAQPVPPSDSSCKDVPNFGAIDSSETCGNACDTFGVSGGVSFRNSVSDGTTTLSCACGPSGSQTQICEDVTPPDSSLGTPKNKISHLLGVLSVAAFTILMQDDSIFVH